MFIILLHYVILLFGLLLFLYIKTLIVYKKSLTSYSIFYRLLQYGCRASSYYAENTHCTKQVEILKSLEFTFSSFRRCTWFFLLFCLVEALLVNKFVILSLIFFSSTAPWKMLGQFLSSSGNDKIFRADSEDNINYGKVNKCDVPTDRSSDLDRQNGYHASESNKVEQSCK